MNDLKKVFGYLWKFLGNTRIYFGMALLGEFLAIVLGVMITPVFFKEIIDLLTQYDTTDKLDVWADFWPIFMIWAGCQFVGFIIGERIKDFAWAKSSVTTQYNAEKYAFGKLSAHSVDFFATEMSGRIVGKFRSFSEAFNTMVRAIITSLWTALLKFIPAIAILGYYAPEIALILFVWFVLFFGVSSWFAFYKVYPLDAKCFDAQNQQSGLVSDVFSNIAGVKSFGAEALELEQFDRESQKLKKVRKKTWYMWAYSSIAKSTLMAICAWLILYMEIRLWQQGQISIGVIVMIQIYLTQIYIGFWDFSDVIKNFLTNTAETAQMIDLIEKPIDIKNVKIPDKANFPTGKIELKNIDFAYEKDEEKLFQNLNIQIPAKQKVGIVGLSGAGKSTLMKLILRFQEPQSGQIQIDGQNIATVPQEDLRRSILYVPQEPMLFHRSIRDNIGYGLKNISDTQIQEAAEHAHIWEFISRLPHQLDTVVGERGVKLSGGQRQRIAIARMFLRQSNICCLDEATSALDSRSETFIQDSFDELFADKTVIAIAHRLSTLKKMDRILVLEKGQIIEDGSFETLLAKDGFFKDLWDHQHSGFIGG